MNDTQKVPHSNGPTVITNFILLQLLGGEMSGVEVSPEAEKGPTKADSCPDENLEAAATTMLEVYKDRQSLLPFYSC